MSPGPTRSRPAGNCGHEPLLAFGGASDSGSASLLRGRRASHRCGGYQGPPHRARAAPGMEGRGGAALGPPSRPGPGLAHTAHILSVHLVVRPGACLGLEIKSRSSVSQGDRPLPRDVMRGACGPEPSVSGQPCGKGAAPVRARPSVRDEGAPVPPKGPQSQEAEALRPGGPGRGLSARC